MRSALPWSATSRAAFERAVFAPVAATTFLRAAGGVVHVGLHLSLQHRTLEQDTDSKMFHMTVPAGGSDALDGSAPQHEAHTLAHGHLGARRGGVRGGGAPHGGGSLGAR